MSNLILHLTNRDAWSAAQKNGLYTAESLAGEGFIHCSTAGQVLRVAEAFYAGQHGLLVLVIDTRFLLAELRWEPGTDLPTERFPHIYGPINLDAVVEALPFEPGRDGKFQLPESLENADR